MPVATGTVTVSRLGAKDLEDCIALMRQRFGFTEADQIPSWLMDTMSRYGGFTLGAFQDRRLIGYSHAVPGHDCGGPFLFSCGLVVDAEAESQGIGEALKLAQREYARAAGYDTIRWTTTAVASRSLHLYLSKLGARLTKYHADMYGPTLASFYPDEVELEWDVREDSTNGRDDAAELGLSLTETKPVIDDVRALTGVTLPRSFDSKRYMVELPWDRQLLELSYPALGKEWLAGVRDVMQALLGAGYVGTAVPVDRSARRSMVTFERLS